MSKHWCLVMGMVVGVALCGGAMGAEVIYVAPDGNDGNPGTVEQPLASLEAAQGAAQGAARNAVRAMKAAGTVPEDGVVVEMRGGVYHLDKAFALTAEDSGTERVPVVYRAHAGETVVLSGGLPLSAFAAVTDEAVLTRLDDAAKGKVLQAAIPEHVKGILAELPTGFRGSASMAELFFDNRPMTLARWPNEGFVTIKKVIDAGEKSQSSDKGGVFEYEGERPVRWANAKHVYLMGYWCHDWYDESLRIKSIDTETKQIALAKSHGYGIGGRTARRYFAFNVLEELDTPGEWYLDRDGGMLYFWPPSDVGAGNPYLTFLGEPLITMDGVSHVRFEGFTLEGGRSGGLRMADGVGNEVAGCTFRNFTGHGMSISGGYGNGVRSCDFYGLGSSGVSVSGGDIKTLTPCANYAVNNHFHHYARWSRTYCPAVALRGVGCRAAHNLIHDAPHMAMGFSGNDHLIEYNDIFRVCTETDDAGAIYTGRTWVGRGTVIRHNSFRAVGMIGDGESGMEQRHFGAHGVYLDDTFSGTEVLGNVFLGGAMPVLAGGGRDNVFINNLFLHVGVGIRQDMRGLGWAAKYVVKGGGWDMYKKLGAVPYTTRPWSLRYPTLATILDEGPPEPRGNIFKRNVCFDGQLLKLDDVERQTPWIVQENNLETKEDPGFADEAAMDLRFKEDSPVWALGFEAIPYGEIGVYKDALRKALPEGRTFAALHGNDEGIAIREARKQLAYRKRRIVYNNDGNDGRVLAEGDAKTPENFLKVRTTAVANTQVGRIMYCTGVFNLGTHRSNETELRKHSDRFTFDWGWELTEQGTDTLGVVADFGHNNNMEVFWSMRMNDTHDSGDEALFCQWKKDHPAYLMGAKGEKFPHGGGRWSAVNYGLPEVREKVFRIFADICERTDIDGFEMDFFRHPVYFEPQMTGEPVTKEHCDMMTDLLRRIRAMADEKGAKRGRPFLISVRAPDSFGFAKGVGLDIERWMAEGLIDMMAGGGYFHFQPWERLVTLGRRYGVPVYACLSASRISSDQIAEGKQLKIEDVWFAEARTALIAGVNGVYIFNVFNPEDARFRTLGSLETLPQEIPEVEPVPGSTGSMERWSKGGSAFVDFR